MAVSLKPSHQRLPKRLGDGKDIGHER